MLKKTVICVFALVVGLTATALAQRPDKTQLPPLPKHNRYGPVTEEFVPGEILVKFRQNFTTRDQVKFNSQVQAQAVNRQEAVAAFHTHYKTRQKGADIGDWQLLKLPAGQDVKAAVTEFGKNALVENVEPNGLVYAAALTTTYTPNGAFNDPYYTDGFTLWWMDRAKGDDAYNNGYVFAGPGDIIVAVLDTGLDDNHSEFVGRTVAGWNYVAGNSDTDDDNIWFGPIQIQGHGTHAAGFIAAIANNTSQIAGTAWDSRIKIMPVKVLDSTASGSFANIANGILYAANNGAHIINLSVGTYTNSAAISSAVTTADGMGVMMIAAAGNDNVNLRTSLYYPACYAAVMSIGAMDAEDYVTYYSNWSDPSGLVDCVAPGGALAEYFVGFPEDNGVTSTARTGGVSAVDGTSFACPQVAGLAALLKLQWPARTPSEIKALILGGAEMTGGGDPRAMGAGRIHFPNSLGVYNTPTVTPTSTITQTSTPSFTATRSPTITPTPSITMTSTSSPTSTISPTESVTFTVTPAFTVTSTRSVTFTITPTSTISPTITQTPTTTVTPSITVTSTVVPLVYADHEFQAYPQPGRNRVRLAYRFVGTGQVSIELYNAGGERVLHVDDQPVDQGEYAFTDVITQDLGTGVYYLKIKIEDAAGARVITGKIAVVH